ncbi:G patch [Geosmithia morbida]|uniref:G patch n=1 Tax=Geosmithia morbida TaxID=1094350 RepID=A0A9P4YW10_9HYPO|nr:G patch [Geosmithia morbida]KAF4123567.1 G patch [Geosmithia morbida]
MSSAQAKGANAPDDDEEDDYMNMSFAEPEPTKETSIQRIQRLKRESRARGMIKSKAEREADEAAAREKALSTSLLDDPRAKKSKGLAMMAKMGFSGGSLGAQKPSVEQGRTEPIHVNIKEDRGGIGLDSERKRKMREAAEEQESSGGIKVAKIDPLEYRDRVRREREEARHEKQFYAAQRMAERLDDKQDSQDSEDHSDDDDDNEKKEGEEKKKEKRRPLDSRPLKSIPVIYRGLVRHRAEQERERRMRRDLEQSLSRLPTYDDDDEDNDDKRALGKDRVVYVETEELEDEDEELDEFNALSFAERLGRVLDYLRSSHQYCFWCKAGYPDGEMDGCPGLTEEDHD